MTERKDGLLYMITFCLLLTLVMLLRSTQPPPKQAVLHKDEKQGTQQERNARLSK